MINKVCSDCYRFKKFGKKCRCWWQNKQICTRFKGFADDTSHYVEANNWQKEQDRIECIVDLLCCKDY